MLRYVRLALLLIVAGVLAYSFRAPLAILAIQGYQKALPCRAALTYSIASIDPKFGISTSTVESSLRQAASAWDKAASTTLFSYAQSGGTIEINFIYDERQATTEKLRSLGLSVNNDTASYDAMHAKYQAVLAGYKADKARFDADNAAYAADAASYKREVDAANARGGATSAEYAALARKRQDLAGEESALQAQEARVNTEADSVNTLARSLNSLAATLSQAADTYNTSGAGTEFEEAVFQESPGHEEINVYEYDSTARLTRVLSHELGHALGMEHVADPKAIMYYLNQGTSDTPTTADMAELDRVCRSK